MTRPQPDQPSHLRRALIGAPILLAIAPARAQASTPAHSLQAVERANSLLRRFATASLIELAAPPPLQVADRRPRHVFHLGQEAWIAADALRRLHGLPPIPPPPAPAAEVTPLDVISLVGRLEAMLADLNRHFSLAASPETPPLREGITPTHVYQALRATNAMLRALGVGVPTPNNVFAVADCAVTTTREVLSRLAPDVQAMPATALRDRTPTHAFAAGRALAEQMAATVAARRIDLPGGVRPLEAPSGRPVGSGDVLELSRAVLADLGALKSALGLGAVGAPAVAAGRSPADVEAAFRTATILLEEARS